ncbi:hypothetical protein BYT27DRAFT_7185359 [Phlegmacium glaucopus]|nr:hypothetical protein BYT27DRAFT_7185359 [Phlegmacium glaucopus]
MSSMSFKLPPDLSIFESGYIIQQDYIKSFFMDGKDEEYNIFSLLNDLYDWWWDLPREERAQTPLPQMYMLDENNFDSTVIWICGRRFVSTKKDVKGLGRVVEQDKDTFRKKKFVTAFGRNRNFDEGQMVFQVLPSRKT